MSVWAVRMRPWVPPDIRRELSMDFKQAVRWCGWLFRKLPGWGGIEVAHPVSKICRQALLWAMTQWEWSSEDTAWVSGRCQDASETQISAQEFPAQPETTGQCVEVCEKAPCVTPKHTVKMESDFKACLPLTRTLSQHSKVIIYLEFLPWWFPAKPESTQGNHFSLKSAHEVHRTGLGLNYKLSNW